MGHANLSNISDFFIRRLYAKGKLSVRECVDALEKAKEPLRASEGYYHDRPMLSMGTEEVIAFLAGQPNYLAHVNCCHKHEFPWIIPHELTPEQKKLFDEWWDGGIGCDWDCGDDGEGGEYALFDSIRWKFAPGKRKLYPEIPRLSHVTH